MDASHRESLLVVTDHDYTLHEGYADLLMIEDAEVSRRGLVGIVDGSLPWGQFARHRATPTSLTG